VKGIEKTAVDLLSTYNTLDDIYASLAPDQGSYSQKLEAGKDAVYHSRHMAQLVLDVPLDVDLEDCKLKGFDRTILNQF